MRQGHLVVLWPSTVAEGLMIPHLGMLNKGRLKLALTWIFF